MTPGGTLRRMRDDAKMTLAEVSKRLKDRGWQVSVAQLSKIENGQVLNIKLYDAMALADLYRVPLADIGAMYYERLVGDSDELDPWRANLLHQLRAAFQHLPDDKANLLASTISGIISSSVWQVPQETAVPA